MSNYITVPIDTDPENLINDVYAFLTSVIPGWSPSQGNLDVWLIQALVSVASESRDVASRVPKSIMRYFGNTLLNLPPTDASAATVNSKWYMVDSAGHTIPAGTQVTIQSSSNIAIPFATAIDYTVAAGSSLATGVLLVAINPGAAASGIGSINGPVYLQDTLAFINNITQDALPTGGQDAETDDQYLGRLAALLTLLAPRPIIAKDFAIFARNVAGAWRAVAIDGYNTVDSTYNNDKMVTIAAVDSAGVAVSTPVKTAIIADLQARREVNFIVNTVDPTSNSIKVTYQVKALPNYDLTALVTAINAALTAYLNQASWGNNDPTDSRSWINTTIVRYLEVAQVINNVPGVDYITTTAGNYDLQIALQANALGRIDVPLVGVAPTVTAGTLTGTAT
jgi:hypothetical protein